MNMNEEMKKVGDEMFEFIEDVWKSSELARGRIDQWLSLRKKWLDLWHARTVPQPRTPQLGDDVIYVMENGCEYEAKITSIFRNDTFGLCLFCRDEFYQGWIVTWPTSVKHDPQKSPGTFHYRDE